MINRQTIQKTTASGVPAGAFVSPTQIAMMPVFLGIYPWSYANDDMDVVLGKFLESQSEEGTV